ncbi:hypothetical protein KCP77_04060 [Salmonella enterica subsp. enterica]|nr:hypothetical protein KCP77_04060 [Salmonella enterica subsp. enterica]
MNPRYSIWRLAPQELGRSCATISRRLRLRGDKVTEETQRSGGSARGAGADRLAASNLLLLDEPTSHTDLDMRPGAHRSAD